MSVKRETFKEELSPEPSQVNHSDKDMSKKTGQIKGGGKVSPA